MCKFSKIVPCQTVAANANDFLKIPNRIGLLILLVWKSFFIGVGDSSNLEKYTNPKNIRFLLKIRQNSEVRHDIFLSDKRAENPTMSEKSDKVEALIELDPGAAPKREDRRLRGQKERTAPCRR